MAVVLRGKNLKNECRIKSTIAILTLQMEYNFKIQPIPQASPIEIG
jgi:hypothetical protein